MKNNIQSHPELSSSPQNFMINNDMGSPIEANPP